MPFQYTVRPTSQGSRYQGQPDYQDTVSTEDFLAELSAKTGKPAAELEPIVRAFLELVLDTTIDGHRIGALFDLIGFQFNCGGSEDTPDFAPTFDNLNMAISAFVGGDGDSRVRAAFTALKTGQQGRIVPVILSVTDLRTRAADHYTPTAPLQVQIANRGATFDPADPLQGIFLRPASGPTVRLADCALYRGGMLTGSVPAGLTGPQVLSVALSINGSVRTTIYAHPIAP